MSSDRTTSAAKLPAGLEPLARPVSGDYVVDSVKPSWVVRPESIDQVQEILAIAEMDGTPIFPWGGGSHTGLGNIPDEGVLALDMGGIGGVADYRPDDLTVSVRAGCTLAELGEVLGERNQMLPVDTAHPEQATIGGMIASGMSGPRRFGYGALRDLMIGITTVLPGGRLAKGGGMVVKNVTGYDMMRLHYGALGSLGVIVQANFKVIPQPLAQRTVLARYSTLEPADAAVMAVRLSQLGPTSIVLLDEAAALDAGLPAAPWTLVLRGEAPPAAAARQAERFEQAVSEGADDTSTVDDDKTPELWERICGRALSAAPTTNEVGVRIGSGPSGVVELLEQVAAVGTGSGVRLALTADYGSGLIYARYSGSGVTQESFASLWSLLCGLGSHAVILTAPPEVKQHIDVFGPEPEGFDTMRSLKEQFDPRRIVNRGRFIGRL